MSFNPDSENAILATMGAASIPKRKTHKDDDSPESKIPRYEFVVPAIPLITDLQMFDNSTEDAWTHDDLFWTPVAELSPIENLLTDKDPSSLEIAAETENMYNSVKSPIPIEWSLEDQNSRFITSFKNPMVTHKRSDIHNKRYQYTADERAYMQANCDSWLKLIKSLGIEHPSDVEFVLRPDFPDVISQIIGTAMRGKAPEVNTDYEFRVRLPPSAIERKIIDVKNTTPEQRLENKRKASSLSGYDEKVYDEIMKLYDNYIPITETQEGKFKYLIYEIGRPGEKNYKKLKLPYMSYRTRENIIRKHLLRQFKTNKMVFTHLLKSIKEYDDTIMYVRTLPDDISFFGDFQSLLEMEKKYEGTSDFDLFIAYRKDYLAFKTFRRLFNSESVNIIGTYSAEVRSSYYRYFNAFRNYDLTEKKVCIITTDKTINDIVFRFLLKSKLKQLHVYGDFNYFRIGQENAFMVPQSITKCDRMRINSFPTKDINIKTQFEQYDVVIIDTVALAVLRNSIVYGDFQEAHSYANLVMQRLIQQKAKTTELFLRAGMANVLFSHDPLRMDLMEIRDITFFKANGPEAVIRFVNSFFDSTRNYAKIRRSLLLKKLVQEDLHKLKSSNICYKVKTQNGYYPHDVIIDDADIVLRLHNVKGSYLSYSKTRNTKRYISGIGADLVQTFLADEKLKTALSAAAFKRKIEDSDHHLKDAIKNPSSMLLTTGVRSNEILAALIVNNYDIKETFAYLNIKKDYTLAEIEATFRMCLNVPIGDNYNMDANTKLLLEAIRYVITYEPSYERFSKRYSKIIEDPDHFNYSTYFSVLQDKVYFKGLTSACEADIYDPMIVPANSIYAYQISNGFTETSDVFSSIVDPDATAENYVYEPFSPGYNIDVNDAGYEYVSDNE